MATLAHYHSWNTRWFSIAWLNGWYWLIDKGVPIYFFNWIFLLGSTLMVCLFLAIILFEIFSKGLPSLSWDRVSKNSASEEMPAGMATRNSDMRASFKAERPALRAPQTNTISALTCATF